MFRRFATIVTLYCLIAVASVPGVTAPASRSGPPESTMIEAGVGIYGVIIGESSMADVVSMYGDGFKLIDHNKYSYEIEYADLGLGFYYCQSDPDKKIFCVEVQAPCYGVTSEGIVLGESTVKDVLNLYGEKEPSVTAESGIYVYEYSGIQFYIKLDSDKKDDKPESFAQRKIISIDVVPLDKSSSFCDATKDH